MNLDFGINHEVKSIEIFDSLGVFIKSLKIKKESPLSLDLSSLKQGAYILKIESSQGLETHRIIRK